MNFQSSEVQGQNIKIGDDDANHEDVEAVFHQDILLEIFIRLPDCRSAICTGIVCHNWQSLISHDPQFIPRFISHHHQHQDRYPLSPFAIFFRKADKFSFDGAQYFQPICKLFSRDPKWCITSNDYLDFLPSKMVIRGSCNDLMLVSPGPLWLNLQYICNLITKQFYQLPEIPNTRTTRVTGHALVCMPGHTNQFKVAQFHHPHNRSIMGLPVPPPHFTGQTISIFCSESREWEIRCFYYPRPRIPCFSFYLHIVSCNGILFWLEFESQVDRVIFLDLTLKPSHCGVIAFPDDSYYDPHNLVKEQIGAVRVPGGEFELRLIQVVLSLNMETITHLKVWKLNFDSKDWVLVHHRKKLKMLSREQEHFAPFVHPTDGEVVFVVWGNNDVFQFNLKDSVTTYEKIDRLQEPLLTNLGSHTTNDRLLSFPIVHPTWPTLLPTTTE